MLKKNEIVRIEITGFTNEGNGVGRAEGIAVFVPFTAVGDIIDCRIVKVNKSFCYGIIEDIITPSPSRCESDCEVYGKCGGCCFRHINYAQELEQKQQQVKDAFKRIGKLDPEFIPIIGSENIFGYRNKAQFPIAQDKKGRMFAGFYSKRSHRVIEIKKCRLLPDIFSQVCSDIIVYANSLNISAYDELNGKGLFRHIFLRRGAHSGELMVCLVLTSLRSAELFRHLAEQLSKKYTQLRSFIVNENPERTNVILGKKSVALYGSEYIYDTMCGKKIAISLNSFYQINTVQAERVYAIAAEYAALTGNETLLDLYCGAGTIGLSMAEKVKKLIGVEIVESAVEDARKNAQVNGIKNAEFICADAEKAAGILFERGEKPDVIIADPARKGCTPETLEYVVKMDPERIVMISCNPATAARDCAVLEGKGYKAIKCASADFFPRTAHVESVVLLIKAHNG